MKPFILLDMNNLCHISHYSMGQLSNDEKRTGVIFGVLKQILSLVRKFESRNLIFIWDSRKSFRKEICPTYKSNRNRNSNPEKDKERQVLYDQITELRRDVIPSLGFVNSFIQSGYEADDLIVKFIIDRPDKEHIIVSTDQDLYQILRSRVKIYNTIKKSFYTEHDFMKEFSDLDPINYRIIKSITGCSSDAIQGVFGVGEKTAVKYLKAEINNSPKFKDIQGNRSLITFNEQLVYLPFKHEEVPIIKMIVKKNELTAKKFRHIFNMYSFESFMKEFPTWEKHFGL